MALSADIQRALENRLYLFSQEAANSGYEYKYVDDDDDPNNPIPSSATAIHLVTTLFVDQRERGAVGRGALRRQQGRYQININAPTGNGDTNLNAIADRLLDWFEPEDVSPLTQGSTTVYIGAVERSSLPWTREPVTDGNWRTKPVIIPWYTDYFPS